MQPLRTLLALRAPRALLLALALPAALGACSNLSSQSGPSSWLEPYRPDVIQGNFVSREMAAQLKPGMSRQEVRNILGTPLLQDVFHAERWDYVFSLRQGHHAPVVRRFAVLFDADGRLLRTEGDPLPSEDEFVKQINALRNDGRKTRSLSSAQLQAQIDAAAAKLAARPAPAASSPQGPLTVVAPEAEIQQLQAGIQASAPGAAASTPSPQ